MAKLEKIVDPQMGELPRWDLGRIYASPDAPELAADKKLYAQKATAFAKTYEGRIATLDAEQLADALLAYEALGSLGGKLGSYAGLLESVTLGDEKIGKIVRGIEDVLTEESSKVVFFKLELNTIDEKAMDKMLVASPRLGRYRHWFDLVRADKPHELSPELERYVAESSDALGMLVKIFDKTHDKLRYDIDGKQLRGSEVLNIVSNHPDEAKRKQAFHAFTKGLTPQQWLFADVYNALIKDKQVSDRWRKYKTPQSARHLDNQVEPEVVDALASTVRNNYAQLSHRYYALKAKWLGKAQLDPWDRNAPLPAMDSRIIPYAEAKKIVLDAYGAFDPRMAAVALQHFDENRIDAPSVPGKASGAFAHPTASGIPGYVLLNYLGRPDDVMTMAHELGHAVNHDLIKTKQPELMAGQPLTLAETASVFGEMLTFKALLAKETDPERRQALIAGKVEDMLNTVVRQIAFYTFESKAHAERQREPLTSERLAELWQETMAEAHGPAIRQDKEYDVWWSYVSHFIHSPFYVYAYAFGDCLVNTLYGVYEQEQAAGRGDQFKKNYIEHLLTAGGSKGHKDLLAPFGLDASKPDFWQKGLDVIIGLIDELEALDKQIGASRQTGKGAAISPPPTP